MLADGEVLPSKFTMIIPRFLGIDAIRNTPGLANANGFIETDDGYQHKCYPEVFAAGVAVYVPPAGDTPLPRGADMKRSDDLSSSVLTGIPPTARPRTSFLLRAGGPGAKCLAARAGALGSPAAQRWHPAPG